MTICIFCFKHPNDPVPWCKDNPGHGCTYGLHHEFPESAETVQAERPKTAKKADKQVCTKCGVHAKNPVSGQNGCQHEYPS